MYLRECRVENVGPFATALDFSLPFNVDGTPQPVILVGGNGSGKSILLSYIADALLEFAKIDFRDVVRGQATLRSPYFRWVTPINQRSDTAFAIALLEFGKGNDIHTYVDKTGNLDPSAYADRIRGRFSGVDSWAIEGNHKQVHSSNAAGRKDFFEQDVACYFPPSRKEQPHWLNPESLEDSGNWNRPFRIGDMLEKPIYVESSANENKRWILDVFLDSLVDIEQIGSTFRVASTTIMHDKLLLKQGRSNIERLLQQVLQDPSARFALNYRSHVAFRLSIATRNGTIVIPGIDNLSSGQSILFNMFATIIRYADRGDLNKSIRLQEIEGIVLIDEIDAHLHSNLQYDVLPTLLALFPKVQFIVTSHAPLFLLGMRNIFSEMGFQIIDMPNGTQITTERFSEFERSLDYYRQTKSFEDAIEAEIKVVSRPLVLTEGETDPIYLRAALELLGRSDLLDRTDIDWVGHNQNGRASNTGVAALNNVRTLVEANPDLIKRKLLLLYDFDARKPPEDLGLLSIRSIPENTQNTKIKKGIENLFPAELFTADFYSERPKVGDYGEATIVQEFDKMRFCRELSQQRRDPADFSAFSTVVDILDEWLEDPGQDRVISLQEETEGYRST